MGPGTLLGEPARPTLVWASGQRPALLYKLTVWRPTIEHGWPDSAG